MVYFRLFKFLFLEYHLIILLHGVALLLTTFQKVTFIIIKTIKESI